MRVSSKAVVLRWKNVDIVTKVYGPVLSGCLQWY